MGHGPAVLAAVAGWNFFFFFFFGGGGGGGGGGHLSYFNGVLPGNETVQFSFLVMFCNIQCNVY